MDRELGFLPRSAIISRRSVVGRSIVPAALESLGMRGVTPAPPISSWAEPSPSILSAAVRRPGYLLSRSPWLCAPASRRVCLFRSDAIDATARSEEHTSEL